MTIDQMKKRLKSGESPGKLAEELMEKGYRRTSNKYRSVSRIDREDWVEIVYVEFGFHKPHMGETVRDFCNNKILNGFSLPTIEKETSMAAHHYRTSLSKDHIEEIPLEIFKLISHSSFDPVGFCP